MSKLRKQDTGDELEDLFLDTVEQNQEDDLSDLFDDEPTGAPDPPVEKKSLGGTVGSSESTSPSESSNFFQQQLSEQLQGEVVDSNQPIIQQVQNQAEATNIELEQHRQRIANIPEVDGKLVLDAESFFANNNNPDNVAFRKAASERSDRATVEFKEQANQFLAEDLRIATDDAELRLKDKFGKDVLDELDAIREEWSMVQNSDMSADAKQIKLQDLAARNDEILDSEEFKNYEKFALAQQENYSNFKQIVEDFEDVKQERAKIERKQEIADRQRKTALKSNALVQLLYSGNEATKTLGRAGMKAISDIVSLPATVASAVGFDEFGMLDRIAFATEDFMQSGIERLPRATSQQRALFEKMVEFEGKVVELDDDGNVKAVREDVEGEKFVVNKEFLEQKDSDGKTFVDRFEESGAKENAEVGFSGSQVLMGKVADGIANLGIQVGQIRALSKALGVTKASRSLQATTATTLSTASMVHRDAYNEAIEAGFAPGEAGRYATTLALMIGASANVFGLEKRLAGVGKTKLPKVSANPKQQLSPTQRALNVTKDFFKEGIKEGIIEEGVMENGIEGILKTAYNYGSGPKMDLPTFNEIKEDAIVGFAVGALASGGKANTNRPAYQKESLLAAVKDPERFIRLVNEDENLTDEQKKRNIDRVHKIGKELQLVQDNFEGEINPGKELALVDLFDVREDLNDLKRQTSVPAIQDKINKQIDEVDGQISELLGVPRESDLKQKVENKNEAKQEKTTQEETQRSQEVVVEEEQTGQVEQVTPPQIVEPVEAETTQINEAIDRVVKKKEDAKIVNDIVNQGQKIPSKDIPGLQEERVSEYILDNSTSPVEVARAWKAEPEPTQKDVSEFTPEERINEAVKGRVFLESEVAKIIPVKDKDFNNVKGLRIVKNANSAPRFQKDSDGNLVQKSDSRRVITDLSLLAEEAGVSMNELEDFLTKYTLAGQKFETEQSTIKQDLADKFEELTGQQLTGDLADVILEADEKAAVDREKFPEKELKVTERPPLEKPDTDGKKKRRGFEKRSLNRAAKDDSAKEVVAKIANKAPGFYESFTLKGIGEQAASEIDRDGGIEAVQDNLLRDDFTIQELPLVQAKRQIVLQGLGFKMAEAIKKEDDKEVDRLFDKIFNLKNAIGEHGTLAGQSSAVLGMWRYMTPEAQVADIQLSIKRDNQKLLDAKNGELRKKLTELENQVNEIGNQLLEELAKNERLKEMIEKGKNKPKPKPTSKRIREIQNKRKNLKSKFKKSGKNLLTTGGLSPEGIEYGVEIAWTFIQEGVLRVGELRNRIRDYFSAEENVELNDSHLDTIQESLLEQRNLKVDNGNIEPSPKTTLEKAFGTPLTDSQAKAIELEFANEFDKKLRDGVIKNRAVRQQLKDAFLKDGKLDGEYENGKWASKNKLQARLDSTTQKEFVILFDDLMRAKGQQQRVVAEKRILNKLSDLEPLSAKKISEMVMAQYYTYILSGPSTLSRSVKGALLTTAFETAVNTIESPIASIHALQHMFGRNGVWAGLAQVPHIMRYGYSDLDYRDSVPRADNHIDRIVNKAWKDFTNSMKNNPSVKNVTKESFRLAYKTFLTAPVAMYRGLIAMDAILKHGLIEHNAFIEQYNKELATNNEGEFYTKLNEKLGFFKEKEFEQQAKSEFEELVDEGKAKSNKLAEVTYVRSRTKELLQEYRDSDITEKANQEALRTLLMNQPEGHLGSVYRTASRLLEPKREDRRVAVFTRAFFRTVFPFLRVPTNFINMGLDYTPWGVVRGIRRSSSDALGRRIGQTKGSRLEHDPRASKKHFIRSAIGATIMMTLYGGLFDEDEEGNLSIKGFRITGGGKDNFSENEAIDGGYQVNSFQFTLDGSNNYTSENTVSFSYVDNPMGMILFPLGEITDEVLANDQFKANDQGSAHMLGWNTFAFSWQQSFSQGMKDIEKIGRAFGTDRFKRETTKAFTKRASAFLVPNLYKQLNKQTKAFLDIPRKRAETFGEQMVKNTPFVEMAISNDDLDMIGLPKIDKFSPPLVPDFIINGIKDEKKNMKERYPEWKLILKYPSVTVKEYYPSRRWKKTNIKLTEKQYQELRKEYKSEYLKALRSQLSSLDKIKEPDKLQEQLNKIRSNSIKKAKEKISRRYHKLN